MRMARHKTKDTEVAYYHCISRLLDRRLLDADEKDHFIELMHAYETFCGVRAVTFCVMNDHFHLLLEVPKRPTPEQLPDDRELVSRARKAHYSYNSTALRRDLTLCRKSGEDSEAEDLRERLFARMWDVSWFMKMLKQRFTQWYNSRNERHGTLWEERFRSIPVEGTGPALAAVAAQIDLNPVRHGMVSDPKDYPFSGYGEAIAGLRAAREGLRLALEARSGRPIVPQRVLIEYRACLYEAEQAGAAAERARLDGKHERNGGTRQRSAVMETLKPGRMALTGKAS